MVKYKICVIFLFVLGLCGFSFVEANQDVLPLFGKIIYVDPGHGGLDPGATYRDIMEKDINLVISKKLEKKLSELGAIVYLTRYGDYDLSVNNTINKKRSDLSRRGNIINKSNCDLFISIHLNAESTGIWKGAQVFYSNNNKKNKTLAEIIQDELNDNLANDREIRNNNEFYLQKRIDQVGVLIEVGFLSNSNERYLLRQNYYQEKMAKCITNAIIKYFKLLDI